MFNRNVGPDIRFTNVEHNQIGLPFQFGRPKPKSTRAAPQEKPRLRPIVIDGQNVAVEHAKRTRNPFGFSSRGKKGPTKSQEIPLDFQAEGPTKGQGMY